MKNYIIDIDTTMKPYNHKKYWIMRDIIPQLIITAESLKDMFFELQKAVEKYGITISNNAIKNKEPMYIDSKTDLAVPHQTGYVITGSTEIYDRSANIAGILQYVDLWTTIREINDINFEEA